MTVKKPTTQQKHEEVLKEYAKLRKEGWPTGRAIDSLVRMSQYQFGFVYRILRDNRLV